jgi:hypothetical protein
MLMRPDIVLHALPVSAWSRAEGQWHLQQTFALALRRFPDLLDGYATRLEGADEHDQIQIMRQALRETFTQRHPNPFAKPQGEATSESD